MAAKLEPTSTPGIFRRHRQGCRREGRCECSYAIVWRDRGRQHTATYRTAADAREGKCRHESAVALVSSPPGRVTVPATLSRCACGTP